MSGNPAKKTAIVSGGSAGLGLAITRRLLSLGYDVTVLGRDADRLDAMRGSLIAEGVAGEQLMTQAADATCGEQVDEAVGGHLKAFGRLDVLINVVGRSDRGTIESLDADHLRALLDANVISTLLCSQACLPALKQTKGTIVNIGSLAGHLAPRFLGGYAIAKHALVGMTRQLRMECETDGVHVGLVSPGPIDDPNRKTENRYDVDEDTDVPMEAARPGGGAKVRRLTGDEVALALMRCIDERVDEIIMPNKTRLLIAIQAIWPTLGKRILKRKTT